MKSILICTTSYPTDHATDGKEAAGAFVAEFASNLSQSHNVFVVAPGLENSEQLNGNITVCRFKVESLPLSLLSIKTPQHWYPILQAVTHGNLKVKSQALKVNPDHILAFWALPSGYWAGNASKSLGVPYSVWCLGSDIWSLSRVPVVRNILQETLRRASHVFADGWQLCNEVELLSSTKCSFLPSSRSVSSKEKKNLSSKGPYKLAFLGRWHENKGIDILLESLTHLTTEDWNRISGVRICGGGPLEELVNYKHSKLLSAGLPVELAGFKDKQGATELLQWADFMIIPSRIESIPVIFSDAMQMSCPVICTPAGDLPALVNRYKVGITAKQTNSYALAKAIGEVLHIPPISYKDKLEKAAEDFSSSSCVRTFVDTIE